MSGCTVAECVFVGHTEQWEVFGPGPGLTHCSLWSALWPLDLSQLRPSQATTLPSLPLLVCMRSQCSGSNLETGTQRKSLLLLLLDALVDEGVDILSVHWWLVIMADTETVVLINIWVHTSTSLSNAKIDTLSLKYLTLYYTEQEVWTHLTFIQQVSLVSWLFTL